MHAKIENIKLNKNYKNIFLDSHTRRLQTLESCTPELSKQVKELHRVKAKFNSSIVAH